MGTTSGKRWKLKPSVRRHRAALITEIWKNKTADERRRIANKKRPGLQLARKKQRRAPENCKAVRDRISKTMKKLRKVVPIHNKGVKGYTNRGSWKIGHKTWITGKTHSSKVKKMLRTLFTPEQRSGWVLTHNKAVEKLAKKLRKKGLVVWSCFDEIPDLLVKEGNKLVAYEVTAKTEISYQLIKRKKHKLGFFDEVRWVDLKGKGRK
jgi:hypothetical protein